MTFVCPVAKGMDLILSYSAYSITDSGSYHLHDKPRGEGYRFSVCLTLDSTPCLGGRERGGEEMVGERQVERDGVTNRLK